MERSESVDQSGSSEGFLMPFVLSPRASHCPGMSLGLLGFVYMEGKLESIGPIEKDFTEISVTPIFLTL
jgi:hypothetical protein